MYLKTYTEEAYTVLCQTGVTVVFIVRQSINDTVCWSSDKRNSGQQKIKTKDSGV